MMSYYHDTIAAIATPLGTGAVGIVRISGDQSKDIIRQLFTPEDKLLKPYRMTHGWIMNEQKSILDEVLVCFMPGPGSYTGEDTVEINCHGNPAILESVLSAIISCGAREAQSGEFTKRAFLNGKMDLTQAEAVLEVINAPTEAGVAIARKKLQGLLGERISRLRHSLENLKRDLCLAVDFPEEELECISREDIAGAALSCAEEIAELISGFEQGRIWTDGVLAVLTGRVNAGKSSLMNAILGRERAIVTDMPGTTRDYLEEAVSLGGLPVRLVDTAGLRETSDSLEKMGMEKGSELIQSADILILVLDATVEPSPEDLNILENNDPAGLVVVLNKQDKAADLPAGISEIEKKYPDAVKVSARLGQGVGELCSLIRHKALKGRTVQGEGTLVPNLRQKKCLEKAHTELSMLIGDAESDIPYDLLAARLDYACSELDQVTGRITPDEVLNSIFDNFCIGK